MLCKLSSVRQGRAQKLKFCATFSSYEQVFLYLAKCFRLRVQNTCHMITWECKEYNQNLSIYSSWPWSEPFTSTALNCYRKQVPPLFLHLEATNRGLRTSVDRLHVPQTIKEIQVSVQQVGPNPWRTRSPSTTSGTMCTWNECRGIVPVGAESLL